MAFDLESAKPVDAPASAPGGFDLASAKPAATPTAPAPDTRAPGETTMSDLVTGRKPKPEGPRLSERVGGIIDSQPTQRPHDAETDYNREHTPQLGRATGLALDNMVQAIRQYFPGMDHEAATRAAKDIAAKQDAMAPSERLVGEATAAALPMGLAGKAATYAKPAVTTAAKVAQALRTVGAGGASAAALTPATGEPEDFATDKARQFAEGAVGTGVLAGAGGLAKQVYKAGKEALSPEQRAASVAKAMEAAGIKLGPTRGSATQTAAADSLKKAETARTDAFNKHAADARVDPTPIPTDRTIDTLERAAQSDVKDGKRMYQSIIEELRKPSLTAGATHDMAVESHRLENIRNHINQLKNTGFNGQPIGQARAKVLDQALKELDESAGKTIPKWKAAFDEFKAKSPAVDALSRDNGSVAGSATSRAAGRAGFDKKFTTPSREVIDGYLSKGAAGMRAAAEATANSPKARAEIRTHFVNDLLTKKNGIENEWAAKAPDLVKSGLFTKEEAGRVGQVLDEYKRVMTAGDGGKPRNVVGAIAGAMFKIPGLGKVLKAGKALNDTADGQTISKAKEALVRATLDPQYGKLLLGMPTPKNIQTALTAMQRAGAMTAAQVGTAEAEAP